MKIPELIEKYKTELKDIELQLTQPASENVYSLLIGKKYSYMSFIDDLINAEKEIEK